VGLSKVALELNVIRRAGLGVPGEFHAVSRAVGEKGDWWRKGENCGIGEDALAGIEVCAAGSGLKSYGSGHVSIGSGREIKIGKSRLGDEGTGQARKRTGDIWGAVNVVAEDRIGRSAPVKANNAAKGSCREIRGWSGLIQAKGRIAHERNVNSSSESVA